MPQKPNALPSTDRIRELFNYDAATGALTHRLGSRRVKAGSRAGCLTRPGYVLVGVDGERYFAHRIIWKHVYGEDPPEYIDHIDGDRANNVLCNLRVATAMQQSHNTTRYANNSCGHKGVHYNKARRRWAAVIRIRHKQKWLGFFDTPEDAHAAYVIAAKEHFGAFANSGSKVDDSLNTEQDSFSANFQGA